MRSSVPVSDDKKVSASDLYKLCQNWLNEEGTAYFAGKFTKC